MTQPKRTKVYLLIEAEVDDLEGFTGLELGKVAVGMIMKSMVVAADDYDKRGLVFNLAEGDVAFQKPRVITNSLRITEDGKGGIGVFA